jgi:hypothetical protein
VSCPCIVGDLDVLDVLQDVDPSVRLEQTDEVLLTIFERAEPLVIEVAAVEDVNGRVEVC